MAIRDVKKYKGGKQIGAGAPLKYPFDQLEVGDCFHIEWVDFDRMRRAAYNYAKRHGKVFKTDADEQLCVRVK